MVSSISDCYFTLVGQLQRGNFSGTRYISPITHMHITDNPFFLLGGLPQLSSFMNFGMISKVICGLCNKFQHYVNLVL